VGAELATEAGGNVAATLVGVDRNGLVLSIDARRREAAVLEGGKVRVEEVVADTAVAECAVLGEASQRVIEGADGEIGRAAKGNVDLFAEREAFRTGVIAGAGVAENGDQNAGLALLGVHRVGDVREEEQGHAEQLEGGVCGLRLTAVEGDPARKELPVRVRQKARRDGAVIDGVVHGTGLDDEAAFEEEGIGVLVTGYMRGVGRGDAGVGVGDDRRGNGSG